MPNYLILTEKPSARKNFEKALGGKQGTFINNGQPVFDYKLINSYGHLLELADPEKQVPKEYAEQYKNWKLENLPWDLKLFKWKNSYIKTKNPRTGKMTSHKSTVEDIKKTASKGFDAIVIATDTDPSGEGELLAWEILFAIGWQEKVYRANFMDESETSIQKSLLNLRDISDPNQDGDLIKGMSRNRWDFASMQLTRAASIASQAKGFNLVSKQGRLKSAMISKIWQQEQARQNYKKQPFYEARYKDNNGNVYSRTIPKGTDEVAWRYKDKNDAINKSQSLSKKGTPEVVSQTLKKQSPPKLLDLSSLSAILSKDGFTADEVQATYQKMYEAEVVSYPRTEDKTITPEQFNDLLPKINQIADLVGINKSLLTRTEPRKSHVKPQGSHGANRPGLNVLSSLESLNKFGASAIKIYEVLAKNYLAILAEDYEYQQIKADIQEEPDFKTTINTPVNLNWKLVYQDNSSDESDEENDNDQARQIGTIADLFIHQGQNPKPVQPTWKWLVKFLEKYDIGTGATRTSTFAALTRKNGYIKDSKGKLSLNDDGIAVAVVAQNTYIADPKTTKRIFDIFDEVGKFKMPMDKAISSIQVLVEHDIPVMVKNADNLLNYVKPKPKEKSFEKKEKASGVWTKTGKEVQFSKSWGGHEFTDTEIEKLLSDKSIAFKATSKKGTEYIATGKLVEQTYKHRKFVGFKLDKK